MGRLERENLLLELVRALGGAASLEPGERNAVTAVAAAVPADCALADVLEAMRRQARQALAGTLSVLEQLARSPDSGWMFTLPLSRELVRELEVEALLFQLERRVAFDIECLHHGVDPRPKGQA